MKSLYRDQFVDEGFIGPIRLLTREECGDVLRRLDLCPKPALWAKGNAVSSRAYYDLATRPDVLALVREVLGDDVLLWGARLVHRKAGRVDPWHTDIESADPDGRSVNVWIGLENVDRQSALQLMSHSHRFGQTAQEMTHQLGQPRDAWITATMETWARQQNPRSRVVNRDLTDGEAFLFDGRLWQYSENRHHAAGQTALLLQYAAPSVKIRVAAKDNQGWPFKFEADQPPCLLVSGTDRHGLNKLVTPPPPDPLWPCWIKQLDSVPVTVKQDGWSIRSLSRGRTPYLKSLKCHVSRLAPGIVPHPLHTHSEEEVYILLDGELDLITVDDSAPPAEKVERVGPGMFVYHASEHVHTIRSVGPMPAEYLVYKWRGAATTENVAVLPSSTGRFWPVTPEIKRPGRQRQPILQSPTHYLGKLSAHLTILDPGAGYPPHRDPYDVAILVLAGTVETLNQRVGPRSVIFYAAHESHGMLNVGDTAARYLVFEFHPPARP